MSKEIRIGLLAIIAIGLFIWGYKFVLGTNVLKRTNTFYVEYENVAGLQPADAVMIHGFQVGTVKDVYLNSENLRTLIVELDVERGIKLPDNTVAELRSAGFMGGKFVNLRYNGICHSDCLQNGDYIEGKSIGLVESMVDMEDLDQYILAVQSGVGGVVDSLNQKILDDDPDNELGSMIRDLHASITNLRYTTAHMNELFAQSSSKLVGVLENLDSVTHTISANNDEIAGMLKNANEITRQLASARLDTTIFSANKTLRSTSDMMESMDETLVKADQTFTELETLLKNLNEGEGTLGKLAKDESLYEDLHRTTENLSLLLQDFRLNPKRYVNVSVFGKKGKDYTVPEDDPAFDTTAVDKR